MIVDKSLQFSFTIMAMRKIFLAIMIALVTLCAFGQNARKNYKAGTEFVESLKYDDAIAQFT